MLWIRSQTSSQIMNLHFALLTFFPFIPWINNCRQKFSLPVIWWQKNWQSTTGAVRLGDKFWGVGVPCSCTGAFHGNEGRIQMLTGLAPSHQTVGSLLRTARWQSWLKKWSQHSSNFANFYILAKVFLLVCKFADFPTKNLPNRILVKLTTVLAKIFVCENRFLPS